MQGRGRQRCPIVDRALLWTALLASVPPSPGVHPVSITYYGLGPDKQLNEIVVAGSHDAGITSGGSAAKTQAMDIGGQAGVGVRVFDLRIAAAVTKSNWRGKAQEVELKAYHGGLSKTKDSTVTLTKFHPGTKATLTSAKAKPGTAFGEGLADILTQARAFVTSDTGKTEFLILKFDKCQNYGLIAQACRELLGDRIYTGGGNLNTRTLRELAGRVITLFPTAELPNLGGGPDAGMLAFKNLSEKGASYDPKFDGLQYYGKGGTQWWKEGDKTKQNIKKQHKIMSGALAMKNPQVVGMIYWTTTGSVASIKSRNEKMWKDAGVAKFKQLWSGGVGEYIKLSLPTPIPKDSAALGPTRKRFMPNIVMIDFADAVKCKVIRDLNAVPPASFASFEDLDF